MRRRLAFLLIQSLERAMPLDRRQWVAALAREIEEIPDDSAALGWAFSSAVGMTGDAMMKHTVPTLARWGLATATSLFAVSQLFPTVLTLAWRHGNEGLLNSLGATMVSGSYHRVVPIMGRMSDLNLFLCAGTAALFVVAALQTLRRKANAATWYAVALFIVVVQVLFHQSNAIYLDIFTSRELMMTGVFLVPLSGMLALMVWLGRQDYPASRLR
jgi:hypothetical protein